MLRTYEGTLKGDHIDWNREAPPQGRTLHVHVTVLSEEQEDSERGQRMAQALSRLAESGAFSEIDDPSQWQHEVRKDRPLPGRKG